MMFTNLDAVADEKEIQIKIDEEVTKNTQTQLGD